MKRKKGGKGQGERERKVGRKRQVWKRSEIKKEMRN